MKRPRYRTENSSRGSDEYGAPYCQSDAIGARSQRDAIGALLNESFAKYSARYSPRGQDAWEGVALGCNVAVGVAVVVAGGDDPRRSHPDTMLLVPPPSKYSTRISCDPSVRS